MYTQPYAQPYIQSHPQLQPSAVAVSSQSQDVAMSHPQLKLFQDGSAPVFRACSSAMQRPTLTNVRIRSTRDANQIFYAVLLNLLPMTVRRLDAEERRAITSGNVYVWEERGATSEATGLGIERWTDGMRWSPSRVRDEFLFYHQKELDPEEADNLPPTRWARIVRPKTTSADGSSSDTSPDKIPHQHALNDPEKLIKQTYSVLVALPEESQRGVLRKWHLTAYFTQSTVDKLQTVDEVLPKPHVMVPEGLFRSARAGKIRRDTTSGRLQQQQRQLAYYDPDPAGPSGSSPVSSAYPPSSSYKPYASSYTHMTPHSYAYSHAQPQYSPYVQDEVAVHRQALPPSALPPPSSLPPAGGPYAITPNPHPSHVPPPPPQGQSSISGQLRGLGLTHTRPPREWDGEHDQEREPREQVRYERDLERERASISPQRIPPALPNTFDPTITRGRVHPSAPTQTRSPSYSHPYANALQGHLVRTSGGGGGGGAVVAGPGTQASVSEYYSPAKPIKPIDVSPSRQPQTQVAAASPASAGPSNACVRETSAGGSTGTGGGAGVNNPDSSEIGEQRESAIGPVRIGPPSPSPRHKSNHLSAMTRLSASPRSLPSSALVPSESLPRLRSVSFSGSVVTTAAPASSTTLPNRSPAGDNLSLVGEHARSLVPLHNLENAVFPRRDPTDDALLRRFNALRTTAPASTARDE
ncbi:hypothetical protein ACEPAH_1978 [Sanghuangporus vaninii]